MGGDVWRACRDPCVLVALAHAVMVPPELREQTFKSAAVWICSGPNNTRGLSFAQAEALLRGLNDGSLIPPKERLPNDPDEGCEGCPP